MSDISTFNLFVRVVEEGNFSAVARGLGVTPSAISRQISLLEDELGTRLFHRTTRKQSLTEAGQIYFQHASRIVTDIEAANLAVTQLSNVPSGSLHVTAEPDFAVAFLAPILPDFLKEYPQIQVRLSMSTGHLEVVDNAIDLAIRFGHLGDSGLIARKLATSSSLVCASPGYLAQFGTPSHPDELKEHLCLSFRVETGKAIWKFQSDEEITEVPVTGPLSANSLSFLRELAMADQGIIMIPSWMVKDDIQSKRLVPILTDFSMVPSSSPVHAVFANNRHLAPKVRAFVDFLAERLTR